jgi:hypothetical protein
MKKVFIVTSGEYSDYNIEAVFSSKELANKYIDEKKKQRNYNADYDNYQIEEYTVNFDDFVKNKIIHGYNFYTVNMNKQGDVIKVIRTTEYADCNYIFYNNDTLLAYRWAKSEKGAIKATNELRAQLIAFNKF